MKTAFFTRILEMRYQSAQIVGLKIIEPDSYADLFRNTIVGKFLSNLTDLLFVTVRERRYRLTVHHDGVFRH